MFQFRVLPFRFQRYQSKLFIPYSFHAEYRDLVRPYFSSLVFASCFTLGNWSRDCTNYWTYHPSWMTLWPHVYAVIILVVINRFSCFLYLIPQPRFPTAFKTAKLIFNHIFWYFGVPEDSLSDWGVQFTSRVWGSFMEKMGVSMSLTIYHQEASGKVETEPGNQTLPENLLFRKSELGLLLSWAEFTQNSICHFDSNLTYSSVY